MTDRITHKMAQVAFERMIAALDLPVSADWTQPGFYLESCGLGRYHMAKRNVENSGYSLPFTYQTYSNREVYELCWFTLRALEVSQGQEVIYAKLQPIIASQYERHLIAA